jgi:hypothetical protein
MATTGADATARSLPLTEACRPVADLLALASSRVTPACRGSARGA